ncbi:MAG: hypothetical protein IJW31_04620 [Lentisphaeria bacterium]|nr:hypothetical protein [Lentisphaeria bacterium]
MKKIRVISLVALLVFSCMTLFANGGSANAWEEWRRGYDLFQKADKELQKGNIKEALQLYKESRDLYLKVQKERPDWNQTIIKRRLELCEEQISKITARLSSSSQATSDSGQGRIIKVPKDDDRGSKNDLSNNEYRQKYFELLVVVENLRKQLREKNVSNRNLETLIKEKQILENNYKALQKRFEELQDSSVGGVGSEEFDNVQKLLIAEKLKVENLEKKLKVLNEELRKTNATNRSNENDLTALNNDKVRLQKSVEALQSELKKSIELNAKRREEINEIKGIVAKNLTTIDNLNGEIVKYKEEITKLNRWIEDLQSKQNNAMHEKVLAENRQIKLLNEEMSKKYAELNSNYQEISATIKTLQLQNKDYVDTIALLERQAKATLQELNNLREQYLLEQKNSKSLQEAHAKLKEENKKNYDNLNLLIAKNEELNLKLNNKTSSEALSYKENQKIREELENQKKQVALTVDALQQNIKKLEQENRELVAENNTLKTQKIDNSQKFVMSDNKELEKLKADYKVLKEKYDFLSMEIESLSKPVAELETKTVNSDEELKTFLTNTAVEALSADDINSSCWYFEELTKLDKTNMEYKTYYLLLKVASDRNAINSVLADIENLTDSAEKQFALNYIAIQKGDKKDLSAALNGKKVLNEKLFELVKTKITAK